MADVLGVDADLVGAPGLDPHLAIGMPAPPLQHAEVAQGGLAGRVDLDVALAALAQAHVQRRIDAHHPVGHAPDQQRQVALGDAPGLDRGVFAQQRLEFAQRRALLGDDHQPGGVAVEPVDELELMARPQRPQGLDDPEADPAAAVAGHARRLVDRQQARILEHDAGGHRLQQTLGRHALLAGLDQPHRRNPHLVSGIQAGFGFDPAAVHAHLATAHDLVDHRTGRALEVGKQEIVEPLAVALVVDHDGAHTASGGNPGVIHSRALSDTLGGRDKVLISQEDHGPKARLPRGPCQRAATALGAAMLAAGRQCWISPDAKAPVLNMSRAAQAPARKASAKRRRPCNTLE